MPAQKPGRSKQDYGTPRDFLAAVRDFLAAVERRFGRIAIDLAAREDNAKAPHFISPENDSLSGTWSIIAPRALAWLNPPFERIGPWAAKCAAETDGTGLRVLFLTPASVGAAWFHEHVHGKALVLALRPRLTFEGCDAVYPKDCILSCFGFGVSGFNVWKWK
jgi:phage N-6-adenine-methyltransferase